MSKISLIGSTQISQTRNYTDIYLFSRTKNITVAAAMIS
jgi:hypothetical protein